MKLALDRPHKRRGVLMLVVVSMLTLFLLLGTTYLVVAARAKQAARAQARLAMDSSSMGIAPARLLDAVLLKVVRGGTGGVSAPADLSGLLAGLGSNVSFESLLGDQYGDGQTLSGTAKTFALVTNSPLLTCNLELSSSVNPADLPGRVLTLLGPNREPTSHRILASNTTSSGTSVVLSNPARRRPFVMPSSVVDARLNGLDFDDGRNNEPYDAFDDKNVFLSHVAPNDIAHSPKATVAESKVLKFGYVLSGTNTTLQAVSGSVSPRGLAYGADNDNDGSPDGFFLNFGLPSIPSPEGTGTVDFHASVLVVDLDSRFNVNAHGSLSPLLYATGTSSIHPGWPTDTLAPSATTLPLGSGYGPPEITFRWMFPQASYPAEKPRKMRYAAKNQDEDDDDWRDIRSDAYLFSGADIAVQKTGKRPKSSRFSPEADMPVVPDMEGRYAERATVCVSSALSDHDSLNNTLCQFARPGTPASNDLLSQLVISQTTLPSTNTFTVGANPGIPDTWWSGTSSSEAATRRSVYNSPPDLHGRMITTTVAATDVVPRLIFSKPEWGDGEAKDDPYELRLDPKSARTGSVITTGSNWDNVFGYAELEGLLRQYDADAQRLPRRLIQLLGASSEESRLRITTDGWDTTLITGTAATTIRNWLKTPTVLLNGTSATSGIIANEIARGERLNLNRPLTSTKPGAYDPTDPYYIQRQALFKDLYTLLTAIGGSATAADRAQWAANVVEFRDADSTITPFEYDPDFADGWEPDGDIRTDEGAAARKVVWGAERPEIVIREAFSWSNTGDGSGGIVLSLHRAWNATAMARVSGSNTNIAAEPCDDALDTLSSGTGGRPLNQVDLGRKAYVNHSNFDDVSAATFPTWRIRIVAGGSTQYIRLDSGSAAASNEFVISPAISNGASKSKLPVDSTLTLASTTTIKTGTGVASGTATITLSGSTAMIPNLKVTASGTVFLERLADLTCATISTGTVARTVSGQKIWDANPADIGTAEATKVPQRYIVVDQCTLPWVDTKNVPPAASLASYRRSAGSGSTAYWGPPTAAASPFSISNDVTVASPAAFSGTNAAWFVWPNRPFVSAAELLLVPQGDAVGILTGYAKPTVAANDLLTLTGTNLPLLMESVHVPTRFAAIHTTINESGTAALANNGIYPETTPVNQISSYREPGRVNLNTITSDDVWNAVVAGPLATSGTTANPVKTRTGANFVTKPAKTMLDVLALTASGTTAIKDTNLALTAIQNRNPLHEIYTATRLANTATTRSNVFAIWVTVRESIAGDPDSVKLHRGFYIVDRSIPVAYDPGQDHNVWDCVVLRRIIE